MEGAALEHVPEGKLNMNALFDLLSEHQVDPIENDVTKLVERYKVSENDVESLLKYVALFKVRTGNENLKRDENSSKMIE